MSQVDRKKRLSPASVASARAQAGAVGVDGADGADGADPRAPTSTSARRDALPVQEMPVGRGRTIVVVTMGDRTDADQLLMSTLVCDVLLRQLAPFAVLMDLRLLTDYPAAQRQMYAEVRERLRPVYVKHHRRTVYLVSNDRQRGFVTAVGWKASAAATAGRTFVESWEAAIALCEAALGDGVEPSPH